MRRYISVIAIVMAACLFGLGDYAVGARGESVKSTEDIELKYEALDLINSIRTSMGVPTLVSNASLNEMAQSHSQYMEDVRIISFEEMADSEYYTGAYPLDRSSYFGYEKEYVVEYNNLRMSSYAECILWCIQDPYQRTALLNPGYEEIGFGNVSTYYCMTIGGDGYTGEAMTTVYPYAGQQGVDTVTMAEISRVPEGLELNASQSIGMPITVQYYNGELTNFSFENIRATLVDTRRQTEMELVTVAPQDEDAVWNTLILLPKERYQSNTGYTVSVKFDVWYEGVQIDSVEEEWSFTSAGPEYLGEVNRKTAILSLAGALGVPIEPVEEPDSMLMYEDVETDSEGFEILYKLRQDEVLINGKMFEPTGYTTREQAVEWLIQMIEVYAPEVLERVELDYKDTFEDINLCSDEARDSVQLAYQLGFIEDQGRGIFNPQVFITKAEMDSIVENVGKRVRVQWNETDMDESE